MFQDYFILSFKNLRHRGLRSWLTLLGIFIGITAVVSLVSLGNGLKLGVASQFGIATTEIITVQAGGISGYGPPGSFVVDPLTSDDVDAIRKLSSVKRAIGRNIGSVKMEFNDQVDFAYAASMPDGDDRKFIHKQIEKKPLLGRFLKDSDSKKIFLGYNFYANKEDWGKEIIPGRTVLLEDEKFEVVGILEKKGSFIFDNAIFINENDMKEILDIGNIVDLIIVQPTNKKELEKTRDDIERLMRKRRDVKEGEEDFQVSTPEAAMAVVNNILLGVQIFIVLIAFISIFIGALGIVNTMTTSVLERKKEIGIMKAIGAKNSQIFFQFFIESGLLGLIGGVVGAIAGIFVGILGTNALNNFLGTDLKPFIDYMLVVYALLGSFFVGAIAGITPAMSAAKQNPVEALRS